MKLILLFAFVMSSCAGYASDNFFIPMGITQSTVPVTLHKGIRTLVVTAEIEFTGSIACNQGVKTLTISKSAGKFHGTFTFTDPIDSEEVATLSVKLTKVQDNDTTFKIGQINYSTPVLSVKLAGNNQLALSAQADGEQNVRVIKPDGTTDSLILSSTKDRLQPNLYRAMYNPTQVGTYVFEISDSIPVGFKVKSLPNTSISESKAEIDQSGNGFAINSTIPSPHRIVFFYTLNGVEKTKSMALNGPGYTSLNINGAEVKTVSAVLPDGQTKVLWPNQ